MHAWKTTASFALATAGERAVGNHCFCTLVLTRTADGCTKAGWCDMRKAAEDSPGMVRIPPNKRRRCKERTEAGLRMGGGGGKTKQNNRSKREKEGGSARRRWMRSAVVSELHDRPPPSPLLLPLLCASSLLWLLSAAALRQGVGS